MSAAAAAVAASRRRLHELVAAFAGAGAIDAAHARTLQEVGMRDRPHALQRLRDRRVAHLVGGDRYWIDMAAWQALQRRRKRLVLIVAFAAFVAGIIASGALAAWLPAVFAR